MKKFSFIIPVYNCEKYLEKCVDKIKDINLNTYEIILVDDGSEDSSGSLCDRLAHENKVIHCMHQKNQGVSAARNTGLKTADGDYVIFLDADDTMEPEKMHELLGKIEEEPEVIDMVIFSLSFDYYYNGMLYRRDEMKTPLQGVQSSRIWGQNLLELYCTNSLSPIWNKVFRRKLLTDNSLYLREDMFLYEDLEYSLRCMSYCNNIMFEREVIYHYRQSEDEGNAGRRLMRVEHLPMLVDKIEDALDKLIEKKQAILKQKEIKSILFLLYTVLAREKINVSNRSQIRQICDDFSEWNQEHTFEITPEQKQFVNYLLNRKINCLILKREYGKIRHGLAVIVKNTRIYKKLKG